MIDNNNNVKIEADEIDLNSFFKIFKRNWVKISIATGIITASSILYAFTIKPIYQGSFEIVVENKNNRNLNKLNSLNNLIGSAQLNDRNTLKTQEFILKSPSVLMPVFEFDIKEEDKSMSTKNLDYKSWLKEYLKIEFNKGTNILLINYKNENKDKILNVLNMISRRYKEYSKNEREKSINNSINYLSSQQKIYKVKSKDSLKTLNAFSIKNGLGDIDGFVDLGNTFTDNININSNEQNIFKELIKNTPLSKNSTNAGFRYKNQFNLLERYEAEYTNLSSVLKPNSKTLKNLEVLIDNLKSSLKRPNEILLKYRELKKIAERDENTLNSLENALVKTQLEKVRQEEPWEMISKPTIQQEKVSPNKKFIATLSFIVSFSGIYLIFLIKEKLSGLIYNKKEFAELVNCNYLETINLSDKDINKNLITNILKSYGFDNYGFILPKSINNKEFSQNEKDKFAKLNIIESTIPNISKELDANQFDKLVIIFEEGKFKNYDIKLLNSYIKIYKNKFLGWFFISN